MNVLLVQPDITWTSPDKNRLHIKELIGAAPYGGISACPCCAGSGVQRPGLIVLPETFTTGFCTEPDGAAESSAEDTLAWMQGVAQDTGAAVAGSVAVKEGGKFYNRLYFVKPDGSCARYDKKHLFTCGGEDRYFEPGNERVIVEWDGVRILLQICYDLRFPVFARNRGDYDMIIYVANWPEARMDAWNVLLRARAVENVCYVAGVNRVGGDPANKYTGGTVLVDYRGQVVVAAARGREEAVCGNVDMESLAAFRREFPVLEDADEFRLI